MVEDSAARKLQGLRLGEQGAKLTVGRNTNDFPPSGPEEASREVQQAVQEAMEQKAEEQAAEATMPAMGPFVPPTDSMSGRGDTGTPQVGHVPEGPATAAPTQGGAAAALREGEVRQVGRSAPAPEDFDRPVPPGDHIQTPKTGGRTADLQLHQKEGKDFVEEPGYTQGSNTAVHRMLPQAALMRGHGTSAGQQGISSAGAGGGGQGGALQGVEVPVEEVEPIGNSPPPEKGLPSEVPGQRASPFPGQLTEDLIRPGTPPSLKHGKNVPGDNTQIAPEAKGPPAPTGTEAEVPGEHAISPDQMMKESSSYVKKVQGNYAEGRAGMSTYGTDLVNETSQNPAEMGPVTATTVADISDELASDIAAGAYGRPEPRAQKR